MHPNKVEEAKVKGRTTELSKVMTSEFVSVQDWSLLQRRQHEKKSFSVEATRKLRMQVCKPPGEYLDWFTSADNFTPN